MPKQISDKIVWHNWSREMLNFLIVLNWNNQTFILDPRLISNMEHPKQTITTKNANIYLDKKRNKIQGQLCKRLAGPIISLSCSNLVWKRVSLMGVITEGQSTTNSLYILPFLAWWQKTPKQSGHPRANLLLISEKTVCCKKNHPFLWGLSIIYVKGIGGLSSKYCSISFYRGLGGSLTKWW